MRWLAPPTLIKNWCVQITSAMLSLLTGWTCKYLVLWYHCTERDLSKRTHFSVILFHFRMQSITWQLEPNWYLYPHTFSLLQNHYYNFWSVQQAKKDMKECVSDILYTGTRNMQWCSPLYRSAILWQHYIVLFSYQATGHYTVYTYIWSDSHMWHAPSEVTSTLLVVFVPTILVCNSKGASTLS